MATTENPQPFEVGDVVRFAPPAPAGTSDFIVAGFDEDGDVELCRLDGTRVYGVVDPEDLVLS